MGCDCGKERDKPADSTEQLPLPAPVLPAEHTRPERSNVDLSPFSLGYIRRLKKPLTQTYRARKTLRETVSQTLVHADYIGTKQQCYLKIVPKSLGKDSTKQRAAITSQVEVLSKFDHPCVLRLYEAMQDDSNFYLAMEAYPGGSLAQNAANPLFREETFLVKVATQVLSGLSHVHSVGVTHSHISPLSIVFIDPPAADNARVKVTGFGDLDSVMPEEGLECAHYQPPDRSVSEKADIWSLGATLYTLAVGESPFAGLNSPALKEAKKKAVSFSGAEWAGRSQELLSLLSSMLQPRVADRPTAAQCRAHPWFKRHCEPLNAAKFGQLLRQMQTYQPGNPLKEGIMKFIQARVLRERDFCDLAVSFMYLDREDGNGVLSLQELQAAYKRIMHDQSAEEAATAVLGCVDLDQNGTLSYTDYLFATLGEKRLLSEDNVCLVFNCLDTDHSGTVTVQELKEVMCVKRTPEAEQQWRALFAMGDKSQDGQIDYQEFKALLRRQVPKQ